MAGSGERCSAWGCVVAGSRATSIGGACPEAGPRATPDLRRIAATKHGTSRLTPKGAINTRRVYAIEPQAPAVRAGSAMYRPPASSRAVNSKIEKRQKHEETGSYHRHHRAGRVISGRIPSGQGL